MGRQHPLDVFRSSRDGFDKASKRRTVAGKVIASSVKVTGKRAGAPGKPQTKTKPTPSRISGTSTGIGTGIGTTARSTGSRPTSALRGASAAKLFAPGPGARKKRSGSARRADGTTRTIFFSAIVMLSAVVLAVVFKQFWLGDGVGDIPTMKLGDVLPNGPGGALAPSAQAADAPSAAPDWFTIRAAIYNGSERGLELATAAHTELVVRGLPEVTLVGHEATEPDAAEAGGFESFELIVGRARTSEALEGTLDRLLAIDDWAGGKAAPFVDASIVGHPMPEALETDP